MEPGMGGIERVFAERFAHWGIRLPEDALRLRQPGHIFKAGWHIGYVWGREAGEEYLEYLSQHRMTDDRRERIYASGRTEQLPVPSWAFVYPPGAGEEQIEQAKQLYYERNRQLNEELRAKGLLPPKGENIPLLDINEYLRSGGDPRSVD